MTQGTFLKLFLIHAATKTWTQFIMMKLSSDRSGTRGIIRSFPMFTHHPCKSHIFSSPVTLRTNTITIAHSEAFVCRRFGRICENERLILSSHTTKSVNKPKHVETGPRYQVEGVMPSNMHTIPLRVIRSPKHNSSAIEIIVWDTTITVVMLQPFIVGLFPWYMYL